MCTGEHRRPAGSVDYARTARNLIRVEAQARNPPPAPEIYARSAWDKILKSDKIQVRFKTSDQPKPRDIEVAV